MNMTSLSSDKKYNIGDPVEYGSVYGYQKFKFPVIEETSGATVGYVKEEVILGEDGEPAGRTYYTRDICKQHGQKRFYTSPEALVLACGGKLASPKMKVRAGVKSTEKKASRATAAKKPVAKKRRAA